jgi:hypothetical protein
MDVILSFTKINRIIMTNNKQQTEINAVEYLDKVNQFAKENNTGKPRQQTAVEWLFSYMFNPSHPYEEQFELLEQAKEMEKEQIGYTKEDVLTAGEMGEINTYDTKHIVSYLDEAKQFNQTYGGNK